jgi:Phage integrase, N-terminal SAM-like domain
MPEGRGLFEVAREKIRTRHLALRTEQAYLQWMRRYVKFHGRRHPRDMGPREVEAFLTHLAVESKVGASTQNQALQALLFLYKHVLEIELPWLENVIRASRPKRLPVVLSTAESAFGVGPDGRHALADCEFALWQRAAVDGGASASRQGSRDRSRRGHRARCQGRQGSGDGLAGGSRRCAARASCQIVRSI